MKTFRIPKISRQSQCCFFLTAMLFVVTTVVSSDSCLAKRLPVKRTPNPLVKAPQVSSKHNPTPDPYFSTSSTQPANSGAKIQQSIATHASGWEAPLTPAGTSSASQSIATPFQPTANQLAPLTSTPGTRSPAFNIPMTNPSSRSASMLAPETSNRLAAAPIESSSIIRQPSTGFSTSSNQNNFQTADHSSNRFSSTGRSFEVSNEFSRDSISNSTGMSNSTNSFASAATEQQPSTHNSFDGGAINRNVSNSSTQRNSSVQASWSSPSNSPIDTVAQSKSQETFEPGRVLAIVGGEPLLVGDILFEVNQMMETAMGSAPPEVKARERKKAIPMLLPQFVQNKLLYMGTLRQLPEGADVNNVLEQAGKEFDENALDKMMKGAGIRSVSEFDAHLRAQGSSLRKLRLSWSKDQLTRFFLSKQIKFNEDVTHQEMLDEYRKNLSSYANPAKCRWEQIMIRFDRSDSPLAAKAKIKELGNQLVYGANFEATAKKSSHGYLAFEGGQHDWTTKGSLVLKELDTALFSLPLQELSDVIQTQDGYHIVRVLERTEASHTPFLKAQVKIKERILKERRDEAFKVHIEKLETEIPVEYLIENVASTQRN